MYKNVLLIHVSSVNSIHLLLRLGCLTIALGGNPDEQLLSHLGLEEKIPPDGRPWLEDCGAHATLRVVDCGLPKVVYKISSLRMGEEAHSRSRGIEARKDGRHV